MSRSKDVTSDQPTRGHDSKPLCGARRRQADATCRRPAGWGTDHVGIGRCKLHGGSTTKHRANAAARAEREQVNAMLERLGKPMPLGDPIEALLDIGAEAMAWQEVVRERLAELKSFSKVDVANIDRERALVKLYGESLDRCHRMLADLSRLNLEERRVRIDEARAAFVVAALVKVLDSLGLDESQQRRARELLAARLGRETDSPLSIAAPQVTAHESEPVCLPSAEVER